MHCWNIENGKGYGFTHPLIANDIADYVGATAAQRDSIVAKKHRGTYVPDPRKKGNPIQKPRAEAENLTPQKRQRMVIALDIHGKITGYYSSLNAAAEAHFPCTAMTVCNRCARRLTSSVNEFAPYGITFRYMDEWDSMSNDQRKADMISAQGSRIKRNRRKG